MVVGACFVVVLKCCCEHDHDDRGEWFRGPAKLEYEGTHRDNKTRGENGLRQPCGKRLLWFFPSKNSF